MHDRCLKQRSKSFFVKKVLQVLQQFLHLRDRRWDVGRLASGRSTNEILVIAEFARMTLVTTNALQQPSMEIANEAEAEREVRSEPASMRISIIANLADIQSLDQLALIQVGSVDIRHRGLRPLDARAEHRLATHIRRNQKVGVTDLPSN